MVKSLATIFVLGFMSLSHALEVDQAYLTVSKIRVEALSEEVLDLGSELTLEDFDEKDGGFGEVLGVIDGLIAVGKKIWPIIEANRPVVSASFSNVNVLPLVGGVQVSAFELEGWRAPKVLGWRVVYENLYGMDVVSFTYKVRFQYGGKYEGKGAYLANATVEASDISVAWGYTFSGTGEMNGLANAGTRRDPVAAATITANFVVKTVLKEDRITRSFYLTGKGEVEKL